MAFAYDNRRKNKNKIKHDEWSMARLAFCMMHKWKYFYWWQTIEIARQRGWFQIKRYKIIEAFILVCNEWEWLQSYLNNLKKYHFLNENEICLCVCLCGTYSYIGGDHQDAHTRISSSSSSSSFTQWPNKTTLELRMHPLSHAYNAYPAIGRPLESINDCSESGG